jgi:hypothetical protein
MLNNGTNVLLVKAANEYYGPPPNDTNDGWGTVDNNPGGLIYELVYEFTGSCGCTCNSNTNVTVDPAPTCSITADPDPACENSTGNSAEVPDAGVNATYTWSIDNGSIDSGQGTNSITWSPTADSIATVTLHVTVTDENGCSSTCQKDVTVNEAPDCTITAPPSVCAGSTGNTASVTPVSGASYTWSVTGNGTLDTGQGTSSITWTAGAASTANIAVTITSPSGCTCNSNTNVTVNPNPVSTAASNSPCCVGGDIQLTGGPGGMTLYSWTGPNGYTSALQSPTITNATTAMAGVYSLTVTDSNGCTSDPTTTPSVAVNDKPTATASSNSPVCIGDTIQLAGGPGGMASYSWIGPNGFSSNLQSPSIPTATTAMAGVYTLSVTNSSGCSNNAQVSVSVIDCGGGGGGGGGFVGGDISLPASTCPLVLTVNMLGQITTATMTSDGVLCEDCLAFDPPKQNSWEAKAGTKLTSEGNKVPLLIKVTVAGSSPPAGNAVIIGPVYELNAYDSLASLTPYPIDISPSSTLGVLYDANELPPNTSEVFIAYYSAATGWTAIEAQPGVVAEVGKANGLVSHFTPFAVLAKLTAPAKFEVSNLTVSPTQTQLNQEVAISVNVANTGGSSGDYTVELKVDGTVKESKRVTLAAGASQIVNFTITEEAVGRYQVEIAGLGGEFEIIKAAKPSQINWWLIGGIIAAIILALVTWMLVSRRRFSG